MDAEAGTDFEELDPLSDMDLPDMDQDLPDLHPKGYAPQPVTQADEPQEEDLAPVQRNFSIEDIDNGIRFLNEQPDEKIAFDEEIKDFAEQNQQSVEDEVNYQKRNEPSAPLLQEVRAEFRNQLGGMLEEVVTETIKDTLQDMLPEMVDQIVQEELGED